MEGEYGTPHVDDGGATGPADDDGMTREYEGGWDDAEGEQGYYFEDGAGEGYHDEGFYHDENGQGEYYSGQEYGGSTVVAYAEEEAREGHEIHDANDGRGVNSRPSSREIASNLAGSLKSGAVSLFSGERPSSAELVNRTKRAPKSFISGAFNAISRAADAINAAMEGVIAGGAAEEEIEYELIIVDVETVEEALQELETSFPAAQEADCIVSELKICSKHFRLKFGKDVDEKRKRVDELAAELERVLNDMYDSQFPSVVAKAKDELKLAEHYLGLSQDRYEVHAFGNSGASILCANLMENDKLVELIIPDNDIKVIGAKAISALLAKNTSISVLNLEKNPIGSGGGVALAEGLAQNTTLQRLNLRQCKLLAEGTCAIAKAAATSETFHNLNLRNNNACEEGARGVAELIKTSGTIREVNLSVNNIGIEGCKALAEALQENESLQILELEYNHCDAALRREENRKVHLQLRGSRVRGIWGDF